ncbi:MAG TPA: alpha/beta hydrolase [Gemmataceae bacterium]|jgi:acetyl esterase/lipase|nr:alpha/beta hydrolase [Gemmataceae bacterium]
MQLLSLALLVAFPWPAQKPAFDRKEDVIYGRKFGMALTMDVYVPKAEKNGAGIVYAVSGGWFSAKQFVPPAFYDEFLRRGYVVFAVYHGSNPRFTIPEAIEDMNRAVRYIRKNAKNYGVDPERLGMAGASAGGHLSLMMGCPPREGKKDAPDPVDRETAKVAAVACFFPPTDFLNYGKPGVEAIGNNILANFKAPFDFVEFDPKSRSFEKITDKEKVRAIAKQISPVYHVSAKSAPTLIFHGDADELVPIQQAELVIERMKAEKVPCELVVKAKAGHGWGDLLKDFNVLADWFDKYLVKK